MVVFHAPPLRKEVLELCKQLPFLQSLRNINSWIRRTNILNMECRLRLCVIVICTCTSLQAFLVTQSIFPTFFFLFICIFIHYLNIQNYSCFQEKVGKRGRVVIVTWNNVLFAYHDRTCCYHNWISWDLVSKLDCIGQSVQLQCIRDLSILVNFMSLSGTYSKFRGLEAQKQNIIIRLL